MLKKTKRTKVLLKVNLHQINEDSLDVKLVAAINNYDYPVLEGKVNSAFPNSLFVEKLATLVFPALTKEEIKSGFSSLDISDLAKNVSRFIDSSILRVEKDLKVIEELFTRVYLWIEEAFSILSKRQEEKNLIILEGDLEKEIKM